MSALDQAQQRPKPALLLLKTSGSPAAITHLIVTASSKHPTRGIPIAIRTPILAESHYRSYP